MALFGSKKKCPVCGKEMTFLSSFAVRDGEICESCEKMLRGKYDIERYWRIRIGEKDRLMSYDPLSRMRVSDVMEMIEELNRQSEESKEKFGEEYPDIFKIDDLFQIAPGALQVGLKRAKQLKNRIVARGIVQSGGFKKGDLVVILHDEVKTESRILDLIPCSGAVDFKTELAGNMHKKEVSEGLNAWMILENTDYDSLRLGDLIVK